MVDADYLCCRCDKGEAGCAEIKVHRAPAYGHRGTLPGRPCVRGIRFMGLTRLRRWAQWTKSFVLFRSALKTPHGRLLPQLSAV
jgi:hypothetical protein